MGLSSPGGGTPAWELLSDTTLAGAGTFDISGISASFVRLKGFLLARTDSAVEEDDVEIFLNGDDTVANYLRGFHQAGLAHTSGQGDAIGFGACPGDSAPANYFGSTEFVIENYSVTTHNKIIWAQNSFRLNATDVRLDTRMGQWENTAIVNQITVQPDGGASFVADSRLQLFGGI